MAKKGVPKRNGSGRGVRANRGRGGCTTSQTAGRGRNKRRKTAKSTHRR